MLVLGHTGIINMLKHVELNMLKPPDIVDVQRSERKMTETISDMQSKVRSSM